MATEGSRSLKAFNYVLIYTYATAHFLLAYYVLLQAPIPQELEWKTLAALLGGASIATVFAIIAVEIIGGRSKARLVELRWKNPYPGCQAFTVHIHEDARINTIRLNERYGPLPTLAREQNALWYQLLRLNKAEDEVSHAHGRSLLFRDLAWVSLLIAALSALASIRAPAAPPAIAALLVALTFEFVLLLFVARRASRDLVKTVLAVESSR